MTKRLFTTCFAACCFAFAGSASATEFRLYSPDVESDGEIDSSFEYDGFGCSGHNRSPELHWENVPEGTRSFVISVHDPDAPTGSGFWHWKVINIPGDVRGLPEGAGAENSEMLPEQATQIPNDFGERAWAGMCPPVGEPHRYTFTLHALDVETLDVDEDATPALVGFLLNNHRIDATGFMATYTRYE